MELQTIEQVVDIIKKRAQPKRVAVAAAADMDTLEAVIKAQKEGLVIPQLFGDATAIETLLKQENCELSQYEIVHANDEKDAARKAVASVRAGKSDLLMKGMMQTGDLMRAVIDKENGLLKEHGTISLFTINQLTNYHKLIVMTDSGIVREPSLEDKKGIIKNAVGVLRAYGYEKPKVAALCAVEVVNPKMPETVDAAALAEMSKTGELADCIVEGPMSMDIALNAHVAKHKGYSGVVAGDPDILLWPNVLSGNIAIKAMGLCGGIKNTVAFAVGAQVPIVMTSRGSGVDSKYLAILGAAAAT